MTEQPQFPPKLAAALCAVSGKVRQLGKSERNQFAKYDFVSVDKFYSAIGPLMAESGIHCIPDCVESEVVPGNVKTDRNGEQRQGAPLLRERWAFTLIHESGECAGPFHRTVTVPAEGAQAHGSSESYAQKQFLRGVFRVPTGDKDDADYGDKPEHGVSQSSGRKTAIITSEQAISLEDRIAKQGANKQALLEYYKVDGLHQLTPQQLASAHKSLDRHAAEARDASQSDHAEAA